MDKTSILFIKNLESITGRHRNTIRRWWELGIFPKPILINNRCAWKAQVVDEWINQNLHGA